MNKLIEVLDMLEDWDLIKTDNGAVGLVIDGFVHSQVPISMGDGIKEIKSGAIDLDELWDNTPSDKDDSVFIGVSYTADPKDHEEVKQQLESIYTNIVEYDPFLSLEENNKKLIKADDHVIIPPSDFHDTHIIGKGLLSQIQERAKVGKFSHVYVDGGIFPIDEVYELKGNDYTKAAVVIF